MSGTAKPSMRGNPRQRLMADTPRHTPHHTAANWLQDRALRALFWGMLRLPYRWRVPLAGQDNLSDLAMALDLPVILVVGVRLGCISHALLTAEAIANDGLQLAGWVANIIDAKTSRLEENLATLAERLPAPCLGRVPKLKVVTAEAVAQHLQLDLLD